MIGIGIALVLGGIGLCVSPVASVRAASRLRFTGAPSEPSNAQVRTWRRGGVVMLAIGLVIVAYVIL